jgi:hypothetical protein
MTVCDKFQYDNTTEAKAAVVAIVKVKKQRMRVYKCDECGYYHLSTIKPNQKRVVKEKHRVDYTTIKPLKGKKEPKKAKPYQEKQMHRATYRPFEQFARTFSLENYGGAPTKQF